MPADIEQARKRLQKAEERFAERWWDIRAEEEVDASRRAYTRAQRELEEKGEQTCLEI